MTKTIGELLIEANNSGDPEAIQAAMKMFWGEAGRRGLPTPEDSPPSFLEHETRARKRDEGGWDG